MNKLKIAYLGVEGAFSYEAATTLYPNATYFNYESFKSIFKALENKEVDYGVIPIENTSTGIINDNYASSKGHENGIEKTIMILVSNRLLLHTFSFSIWNGFAITTWDTFASLRYSNSTFSKYLCST